MRFISSAFLLALLATSASAFSFLNFAEELQSWLIATRRELHQMPELGFEEFNTSATIRRHLDSMGISYKYPYAKTGLVATIGSGAEPIVALRSDIDALPVIEPEGVEYRSRNQGRMHACGHDAHMTMLLGAAKLLKGVEKDLPGTVKLIFQPAEEGGAGGEIMVNEGALEGASAAFGMHVWPSIPSGHVATKVGTIMAGALSFRITVKGRGGHAALPHMNIDPVVAAASLITSLQTLVSRETSPLDSAVLSVTMLHAGDAYNVIPDEVMIGGTIRALTHETLMTLKGRVEAMSPALVSGFGCNAEVDWRLEEQPYYPPTVNHASTTVLAKDVASKLLGDEYMHETEAVMAGEDFAFFGRAVPATFLFLGIKNETVGSIHNLHNANFKVDEGVLYKGAALHASIAMEYLQANQKAVAQHEEL